MADVRSNDRNDIPADLANYTEGDLATCRALSEALMVLAAGGDSVGAAELLRQAVQPDMPQDVADRLQAAADAQCKRFAMLQARAALAGWMLHRQYDDDGAVAYLLCRWRRCRELRDLAAVESLLDMLAPQTRGAP